ncbi:MAG TPA: hypothetical protein ENH13_02315 [Euryarchaeota archaeon]|nr:hypothetical protein BMS3Abin16_00766 [archaeon BMS3Abin16]GBE55919.1 hypothetical protein BMS3Bbin16_00114 [archaeon BMS3Bbin16]HDH27947.1 hypothetical protein [Euryarchaeota archaeon]
MAGDSSDEQDDSKVYCKKCGAWVFPENGACPRCGYVFEKKSGRLVYYLFLLLAAAILFKLLV